MNAGAYGGELKDVVKGVLAVSPDGSQLKVFTGEEMEFGYRHSILEENGYINDLSKERLHHEIYLSDARRVAPEKWKTVIRHPIKKGVRHE